MLRASSLGLRLPPSVICGQRQCFLIPRTISLPRVVSPPRTRRPYSQSAQVLKRNDGRRANEAKNAISHQLFPTQTGRISRAEHANQQDSRDPGRGRSRRTPQRAFDPRLSHHRLHSPCLPFSRGRIRKRLGRRGEKKKNFRDRKQRAARPPDDATMLICSSGPPSCSTAVKGKAIDLNPTLPRAPLSDQDVHRRALFNTINTSWSLVESWSAYSQLLRLPSDGGGKSAVPLSKMHRLCQTLASHQPRTRTLFLQFHSVLLAIRQAGGKITLREWNALIDCAGKGLRRTTAMDYENSVSYFRDMTQGYIPGTTLARRTHGKEVGDEESHVAPVEPDIYTYTTLLNIAARTRDSRCFRHASSLLEASGLRPNRITHLALVKYFTATNQLSGVRSTLLKMEHQDLDVGTDGMNALLMAYAQNQRLDVALMLYRMLRHNVSPEVGESAEELARLARQLQREELIVVPPSIVPDEITYTSMVQIMAYHGDLEATLNAFVDMVSTPNTDKRRRSPSGDEESIEKERPPYEASFAVFRAIFLGFSRHGVCDPSRGRPPHARLTVSDKHPRQKVDWTLSYLETMFNAFMSMADSQVNRSVAYWIMVAFKKTSGSDQDLLRRVLTRMEERFPGLLGGGDNRLIRMKAELFRRDGKGGYL